MPLALILTARERILLVEFDYDLRPVSTIPLLDTARELRDFGLLKPVGLPRLYWNFMLTGIA
jgi:sulfide:quinone oxidoreductase